MLRPDLDRKGRQVEFVQKKPFVITIPFGRAKFNHKKPL